MRWPKEKVSDESEDIEWREYDQPLQTQVFVGRVESKGLFVR